MTTSVRAGGVYGASITQRSLPAAPARSEEWQTLYQRQLAQEAQDGPAGARDAHSDASASQSTAPKDGRPARDPARVVADAVAEYGVGSRPPMLPPRIGIEMPGQPKTGTHSSSHGVRQATSTETSTKTSGMQLSPSSPASGAEARVDASVSQFAVPIRVEVPTPTGVSALVPADGRPESDPSRVAAVALGEHAVASQPPMLAPQIDIAASGLPKTAARPSGTVHVGRQPTPEEASGSPVISSGFASGQALAGALSGAHGARHGVGAAQAGVLTSKSARPADDRPERDPPPIAVITVGAQLQARIVGRDTADTGSEPNAASNATAAPNAAAAVAASATAAALLPRPNALPGSTPSNGARPRSAREDREPAAAVSAAPTTHPQPESDKTLARALTAPAALALPAAVLAQAGGPADSQHASRRLPSSETAIDAVATSAPIAPRAGAAAGAGAGTTQQRGGDSANRQRSEPDAFSTASGSSRHYGTFPLIVSGELLELEFVSRRSGRAQPAGTAVSQIFVSLQPPGMGRLQLTARNLGDRVTVSFGGQAAPGEAVPALDVPALLQRLGWGAYPVKVDGVVP